MYWDNTVTELPSQAQVVILNRMIKGDPIKKVMFNQDLGECKGVCHVDIWGNKPGRGRNSVKAFTQEYV